MQFAHADTQAKNYKKVCLAHAKKTDKIKKSQQVTTNIVHLADSINMEMLVINKISHNLKMKCFKMPNAPYSNRYAPFKESPIVNRNVELK